jgi:acetylornithine/N-succinyldiaminopimelate aminotransferase
MQPTSLEEIQHTERRYLLQNYERYPLAIERGEGCYVYDVAGKRYLDMITGIGVNALGYGHPRIAAALAEQAARLLHTSNLVYHRYQGELARLLCDLGGMDRAFFSNSGSEAMECALKAVRAHGRGLSPRKLRLVALDNSFHGRGFGALAVTGNAAYRRPFEPLHPEVTFVAANDEDDLRAAFDGDVAGVIVEAVQGEAGVYPLMDSFLRLARELATRHEALLVADETQCGLGRTGKPFAYQWSGIHPDLVATAKPLAGGLPLGATLFTEQAARPFTAGLHGTTCGGNPLACRVAIEFLEVMEELLPHIAEIGGVLRAGLDALASRHEEIREIRSKGLMLGVEMDGPAREAHLAALERGLLINCAHGKVLRMLPPFVLTREQAGEALGILDKALTAASTRATMAVRGGAVW